MKRLFLILTVLTLALTACDKNKDYIVTIHTEYGDMKLILYDETPLHKKNFLELASEGKYDSTTWHRVIEGFMIQGGDVNAKEGTREKPEDRIPAEIVEGFWHTKGSLAAARQGDNMNPEKKSSAVQFYIVQGKVYDEDELTTDRAKLAEAIGKLFEMPEYDTLMQEYIQLQKNRDYDGINQFMIKCKTIAESVSEEDLDMPIDPERLDGYTTLGGAPHLDREYTVFGRVVEGLDVIDKIAAVKTGRMDKPVQNSYITMEVGMMPKKKITELYGYEYPEQN
ncbi:peptidylprolyl isomerase [Marinoscillum sp. MHG1-6]|uniref:peptidylprolyl isomerase n=1 Tax=Marinoscillum sp. MHG1-6 TaxID=2959627 RepID=UPI0021570EF7|nr:peptidylprolyl isomerase [Marinoscillum sp. MHG1-6]